MFLRHDDHLSHARPPAYPLTHFYFPDPRLFLVPIEHLTSSGMSAAFAERTQLFLESLIDPGRLPKPSDHVEQTGYTFLHRDRRLLAYNLDEPGIDRLHSPSLPYARAMLGARALHEWAHLAVDAGCVPRVVSEEEEKNRVRRLAEQLHAVIRNAPEPLRRQTKGDLAELTATTTGKISPAEALAGVLMVRLPDYRSNLLAARFWSVEERETYVRQNIRTLRGAYAPAQIWRMLVRYLYEYQYLRFSAVEDEKSFFLRSTWFDTDFFASGLLDEQGFDRLVSTVVDICDGYSVDGSQFRF